MSNKTWSNDEKALARQMFEQGKSHAEIGAAVGRSRSAAIGECNRLKLHRAVIKGTGAKRALKSSASTPQWQNKPPTSVESTAMQCSTDDDGSVGLLDLKWWMCQSVVLKIGPDNYPTYCGKQKTTVPGSSKLSAYCALHHRVYHHQPQHEEHLWRKQQRR